MGQLNYRQSCLIAVEANDLVEGTEAIEVEFSRLEVRIRPVREEAPGSVYVGAVGAVDAEHGERAIRLF